MQVTDFTPQIRSHRGSQQDRYSTDLFTHPRKFNKPIKNPADYDGTRCYVIILNTLSVSLLLIAAAKKKLLYSLPQAFEEKQKRSLMVCMLAIVEITPR